MSNYIDITVPISHNMTVYPGDPQVELSPFKSIKGGDNYNLTLMCMGSHTGTHLDAPSHYFQSGKTVDEIEIEKLILPVKVVLMRNQKVLNRTILSKTDLGEQKGVLFKTDHSFSLDRYSRFRDDYVHLSVDGCGYMAERGFSLVGIDSFSIESFQSKDSMGHKILLGAGILILEMLDLKKVNPGDYQLICLPLKINKGDGAPVRAILKKI